MPNLTSLDPAASLDAAVLVVTTRTQDGIAVGAAGSEPADRALDGHLDDALRAARAAGSAEEIVRVPVLGGSGPSLVVAVGLGEVAAPDAEVVRRAVGAAVRSLTGVETVAVSVGDDPALIAAAAEGAALGGYAFTQYKSDQYKGSTRSKAVEVVQLVGAGPEAIRRADIVTSAVATVRDQVNMAPAQLYPQSFAELAATAALEAGCTVEILDEQALAAGGYGGLLGVGAGSSRPPRLVRVTYRPDQPVARIALVGKGITFDSGGYNLKVPAPVNMKCDMAGAATVLAVVGAVARLGLPIEVTATAAMAQNMISGDAYLPSDVLTIRGGTTVEVTNTDAEGRLVLADAIVRAGEDTPDYLIETSTLTGAQLVALGPRTAGVMGTEDLRTQTVAAGAAAGESMWAMPLLPELRAGLDSPVADLRNATTDRHGGMLVGGLFLAEFVPGGLPWVHIDIAGPAWNDGAEHGYTPKGGTGYGVRTIIGLLEQLSSSGV